MKLIDAQDGVEYIIKNIVTVQNPWILFDGSLYNCGLNQKNFNLMIFGMVFLLIVDFCKYQGLKLRCILMEQEWWLRWLVLAGGVLFIVLTGCWGTAYDEASFIYFQF